MSFTETEIQALEKRSKLLSNKINKLKNALILETNAARQFQYEIEIEEDETELQEVKKQLAEAFNIHSFTGKNLLYQKLESLKLDIANEIGIYQLVNCNRELVKDLFWDAFDKKENEFFQFYFISACPTQMPPSFAERMIYELILEQYDEVEDALFRLRREDTDRVRIVDLPMGRNLSNCQKTFKKFLATIFNFTPEESFENFLKTGIPKLKYDAVALIFKIEETKWKDYIISYFEWLIKSFTTTYKEVPTFLFFFICYKRKLHLSAEQNTNINQIDKLAVEYEKVTHISPLNPVSDRDLKDWIRQLGETNEAKVEESIELLIRGLKASDKKLYNEKKLLNMDDIERFQEIIYEIGNQ